MTGSSDGCEQAVKAPARRPAGARHVIPGHQVVGIDLKTYRPTAEEWSAQNAPWVSVTDEQVRHLARTGKNGATRSFP
jgi:hypothetical protein